MTREEEKNTVSEKHKPPPPLSGTIHWQAPSPSQGATTLCPPVYFGHRWMLDTCCTTQCYNDLKKWFGAIYCQPQQTATCVEPNMMDFWEDGKSQVAFRGFLNYQRVKRNRMCNPAKTWTLGQLQWITELFPSSWFAVTTNGKRTVEQTSVVQASIVTTRKRRETWPPNELKK